MTRPQTNCSCVRSKRDFDAAFTLTELLVIVAVVVVLVLVQWPALTRAKVSAKQIQCLNNLRHLANAWRMYSNDHGDQLVNNFGLTSVLATINDGRMENWANHYLDWTSDPINTNQNSLKTGLLTVYLGGHTTDFKCPADNYLSASQRAAGFSARTRSVAMNAFIGPFGYRGGSKDYHNGRNSSFPDYRQWLKMSEFVRAANTLVFLEEHPDALNDGLFLINPQLDVQGQAIVTQWSDAPASFHDGAANLTFADGHTETRLWRSDKTRFLVSTVLSGSVSCPPFGGDLAAKQEATWVIQRLAVPYPNY